MNSERLFLVDPYDEDHLKLIEEFEKERGIQTTTSEYIRSISQVPKAIYEQNKELSNETRTSLFLESSSKITDICYIEGEKDVKTCQISFAPYNQKSKKRKLISYATDFAINTLHMKEIFIKVKEQDKNMIENLENLGFENLGTEDFESEDGTILFLKEAVEDKLNVERHIA